ncbi:MAG TPA: aminotransferase class V-fold PLP-dependent enzyme, partial [Polyangiaceae bacterium]|nr:aminotransferase class V-fold PLP-dependent enzyme [Polyangiaceae bacterium]
MDEIIYLDCASLLPPRERVLATVARSSREAWGNPHALHPVGHRASEALERARIQVAEYLDAPASEVIFVSSGRDAMLRGIALALQQVPSPVGPIVSSRLEHP